MRSNAAKQNKQTTKDKNMYMEQKNKNREQIKETSGSQCMLFNDMRSENIDRQGASIL